MKCLIILALFLANAFALSGKEIGSRNVIVPAGRLEGRIINGKFATEKQFPYVVGIYIEYNATHINWCGGSLINNEWVLTAAHCTFNAKKLKILLGTINSSSARKVYDVTKRNVFNHELYKSDNEKHDIALVKIKHTAYTDYIKPIKLPTKESATDYKDKYAVVAGWGLTKNRRGTESEKLKYARLSIMPNDVCLHHFKHKQDSQICTGTTDNSNVCVGDSGGPLVLENTNTIIGITSASFGICLQDEPTLFTRVASYLDWIEKTIRNAKATQVPPKVDSRKIRYRKNY